MEFKDFWYAMMSATSGYNYTRRLLESNELGEYETLDALKMSFAGYVEELKALSLRLCNRDNLFFLPTDYKLEDQE